jgi:hypothetical protein
MVAGSLRWCGKACRSRRMDIERKIGLSIDARA